MMDSVVTLSVKVIWKHIWGHDIPVIPFRAILSL